jgi:hypothetical protein
MTLASNALAAVTADQREEFSERHKTELPRSSDTPPEANSLALS